MAERLTRNNKVNFYFHDEASNMVYYKLQDLEDIMDKYGIESLDTLEHIIKKGQVIIATTDNVSIYEEIQKDRNTWKRACEFLAYEYAEEYFDGRDIEHCFNADKRDKFVKENINYFYQQAKKESKNNDTNN